MITKKYAGKIAGCFSAILLLLTTAGCGTSNAATNDNTAEPITIGAAATENTEENDSGQINNSENGNENSQENNNAENSDQQPTGNNTSLSSASLKGNVISIGNNSFVISQVFEESSEGSGDAGILIAYAPDTDEAVIITVHVSESTKYEIKTVRNGGVNGDADVDIQEGSFSDVKEDMLIDMTGHYDGNDFEAELVTIYQFV